MTKDHSPPYAASHRRAATPTGTDGGRDVAPAFRTRGLGVLAQASKSVAAPARPLPGLWLQTRPLGATTDRVAG
jgi:hypothetical protein